MINLNSNLKVIDSALGMSYDYSVEELCAILSSMAEKVSVSLSEEALAYVKERLHEFDADENKRFGNARGIRNAFEKIMIAQANRLVLLDAPSKEELSKIEIEDVKNVL